MTRPMLRTLLGLAAFAALALAAPAAAQTFLVSATVSRTCTVTTNDLVVGAYDPVSANDTAAATGSTTLSVRCTRGTAYSVALDEGLYAAEGAVAGRKMKHDGANGFLSYELYSDSGFGTIWNTATPVTGTAASRAPIPLTVFAQVPGGQDVPEGAYVDSVTATINF